MRPKRQAQKFRFTCLKVCVPVIKKARSNPLSRRFQNHPDVHREAALLERARAGMPRPATNSRDCRRRQQLVVGRQFLRLGCPGGGGWARRFGSPCSDFHPAGVATQRLGRAGGATVADGGLPPRTTRGAGAIHPPATGTLIAAFVSGLVGRRRVTSTHPTRGPAQSTLCFSPRPQLSTPPPPLLPPLPLSGPIATRLVPRLVSHHGVRRD